MMKKQIILILCMVFVVSVAFSQDNGMKTNVDAAFKTFYSMYGKPDYLQVNKIKVLPSNFYSDNLGFFCKQELKMQAVTLLPIKIRLGSVSYCDWMEGKRNAGILQGN